MATGELKVHNSDRCPTCDEPGERLYVVQSKRDVRWTSYRCLATKPGSRRRCKTEWQGRQAEEGQVGSWRVTAHGLMPLIKGGVQFQGAG